MLFFQAGDCRLRCLLALIPLFQTTDFVTKLELFTNRFKVLGHFLTFAWKLFSYDFVGSNRTNDCGLRI